MGWSLTDVVTLSPFFVLRFFFFPFSTNCSTHCIRREAQVVVSMMGSRDYYRGSAGQFYVRSLVIFLNFFLSSVRRKSTNRPSLPFLLHSSPISADFRACSLYEVGFREGMIIERRVWNEMGVRMPAALAQTLPSRPHGSKPKLYRRG